MSQFKPETIARIEHAVPVSSAATALDVWRDSGGLSHQHVKNALKVLVEGGRVLRTQEIFRSNGSRVRYRYQRVSP